jgi:hypothetical protein
MLSEYIRITTTNPTGIELAGLSFLRRTLAREGVNPQTLDNEQSGAGCGNLYARFAGTRPT